MIAGAHLTLEEAQARFGEEYASVEDAAITGVTPVWIRFEFIGPNNYFDGAEDTGAGWLIHEQTERPRGVVRPATVIA